MDFFLSDGQRALRDAVREFLEDGRRAGRWEPVDDGWIIGFDRAFSRALGERGWIGMTWPRR
jgi:acyl-CoA dehydrogenase